MVPAVAPLRRAVAVRRVPIALGLITVAALALRLHGLGQRVFYYDEAWFGYWTLRFVDTGVWRYRPILHGPFFARANSVVFPLLGATDGTARLVVALVGGLLPLSAWLFRERLRDVEVIALGGFLAFTPVLLYYSRFMRNDVPLAAFMLVTLGLLVRAVDTGRHHHHRAPGGRRRPTRGVVRGRAVPARRRGHPGACRLPPAVTVATVTVGSRPSTPHPA